MNLIILILSLLLHFFTINTGRQVIKNVSPIKSMYKKKNFNEQNVISCAKVSNLIHKRDMAMKSLKTHINSLRRNRKMNKHVKYFQAKVLEIFQRELNNSGLEIYQSINWLDNVLKGDLKNVIHIEKSSEKRLNELRSAALKEEIVYKELVEAEDNFDKMKDLENRHSEVKGVIVGILKEISKAADSLERKLDNHAFDIALFNAKKEETSMEMVVRIEEKGENSSSGHDDVDSLPRLVDAYNNQFVLSRPADTTIPKEDHFLLHDLAYLIILSTILGWFSSLICLPSLFGHIAAGIILGPSCLNLIKSLVQFETIAQLGMFFILFMVGLDFSPDKIKKISTLASLGQMILLILGGIIYALIFKTSLKESCFVAACLGFSSTPLVTKFLSQRDVEDTILEYSNILVGILIMQDVWLCGLVSIMPSLSDLEVSGNDKVTANGFLLYGFLLLKLLLSFLSTFIVGWLLNKFCLSKLLQKYILLKNREQVISFVLLFTFTLFLFTDYLNLSMELGCFLAGALISVHGDEVRLIISNLIEPIKDLTSILFFASIGLHVYISFLIWEITILLTFTFFIVFIKFTINFVVLSQLSSISRVANLRASIGLAQVSEFSFILGSRARILKLISREVYLLILGITCLSFIIWPLLWRIVHWTKRRSISKSLI